MKFGARHSWPTTNLTAQLLNVSTLAIVPKYNASIRSDSEEFGQRSNAGDTEVMVEETTLDFRRYCLEQVR